MSTDLLWRQAHRLLKWQHLGLAILLVVTLIFHFSIIFTPDKVVFDEQFYVEDARRVINGDVTQRGEHPPLGKVIVLGGMELFGDNPFGWRFISVIFSTAGIALFYFICRKLGMGNKATLIATFLLAFENLYFVQGSIGMLDVFFVTLSMAAFLIYLHGHYEWAGITVGLAALAKLNGFLAIGVIGIHWLLMRRDKPLRVILSVLLMGFTFLGLFAVFNYFEIGHKWADPLPYIYDMIRGTESLKFSWVTHPAAIQPWKWLYDRPEMAYYINPNYSGMLSYTTWALIVPATVYMIWRAAKRNTAAMFGLAWVYGTYFIWYAAVLITDRVTYPYYLLACIGGLCIGIGLALEQLLETGPKKGWRKRGWLFTGITAVFCLGHLAAFFILTAIVNRPPL
jgi:dolichyl-phosphate-mannose-protein mannosyltransferase